MHHYFGNRYALVASIIEHAEQEGTPYLAMTARPSGPLPESMVKLANMLSRGFENGVLALQVIGLTEGFADEKVASSYLGYHLEPILSDTTARLDAHIQLGEMWPTDVRYAAIQFLSPILVAHLHQTALAGRVDYPMSVPDFISDHVGNFVRAHASPSQSHP